MRRVQKANADLVGEMKLNKPTSQHYSLFRSYLDASTARAAWQT